MSGAGELVVIVDGSNVARCSAWIRHMGPGRDDHELRRALVDAIASWTATSLLADRTVIVFDGAGPWRAGETKVGTAVIVTGSGAGCGDELVEAHAARLIRSGMRIWVVSSDRLLQSVAGARAERSIGSDDFATELLQQHGGPATASGASKSATTTRSSGSAPPPSGIGGLLDDDVRARLERLRRGF